MKITKKSFQSLFTRASFAGLLLAGGVTAARAQTSGSLNTTTSSNYSTAPWTITAGTGTYPDGGGTATFNSELGATPGTAAGATVTITLDVSPTLGAVVVNNPFFQSLAGTATTSLIMPATGTTFTLNNNVNSPSYTLFGFQEATTGVISGGGTAGLIATGSGGSFLLSGTNTYTGGTHIGAGANVAVLNSDTNLGATGTGNGIYLTGGGTFVNDFSAYTTTRDINLGAGGGNFLLFYAMADSGTVSGTGSLNINNAVLTLTGTNTYTGATNITSPFAGLTLSGAGTTNTSSAYDFSGTITLDSSGTNNADRLNNSATITDRGATIALTGNANAATNEVAGPLVLANGINSIVVTPNTAQPASLSFSSITRQNGSTMFLRGTGLGGTAGNGVAEITTSTAPTLVGGGGLAGSQNISILPWAVGNTSATATTSSSFVTYDSTTGQFRPLATTEYSTLASGENDTNNTIVTAATAISAATTVNSVLVTGTGTLLSGTGGLTITSGALMYSPAGTTAGTISANINFGTAEGIISTTAGAANSTASALTLSGVISGSGGLTINSVINSDIAITGANTYTGTTTLLGGLTKISGTIASDGVTAGPFGLSTSAIVLNETGNSNLNGIYASAATTFNRPLSVIGGTNTNAAILLIGAGYAFTLNGPVSIAGGTQLAAYDTGTGSATNAFVFNNIVSGAGGLTDESSGTYLDLNAANTYSGGTNIYAGKYVVGIDSVTSGGNTTSGAFGTGTIYFSNSGSILSSGTTAHTVSNPIVMAYSTATFAGTGALTFTGPVNLDGAKTIAVSNTAGTTFTGVISNGSISKTGTGPLSLNSATGNTYTGGTVLGTATSGNLGALFVNNASGSGTGTGAVFIGATSATTYSTLAGSFTIAGPTTIYGRLSPGNGGLTAATAGVGSIGTDNLTTLTLASSTTSSLFLEAASGSSYDQINVSAAFTLNGTVNIATTGGYTIQAGDTFHFVNYGTSTALTIGTYTFNTASASLAPGVTLDTSMFATTGVVTAVPEPGTLGLFGAVGGLGIFGWLRRRRAARA